MVICSICFLEAGKINNDRYDDVLENTDSVLPEEISDDENNGEEEGGEDAGGEDILDKDNYGLGIGTILFLIRLILCRQI